MSENTNTNTIKTLFEENENLSLRKLALACEISYGVMMKAAKKPVAGVPYDPTAINYEEISALLERRKIDVTSLDVAQMVGEARKAALKNEDLKIGDKYMIRNDDLVWTVIALTNECICIQSEETLRAMSIATFLHQTPRIQPTSESTDSTPTNTED